MNKFFILDEYCNSVTIRTIHSFKDINNPTEEELLKVIGRGITTSVRSEDHPMFADLRNKLENDGFIETQRSWWNGDVVLKEFYLNNLKFKVGEKFPCAGACGVKLKLFAKK